MPTPAGEALARRAERIEAEMHAAERELGGRDVAPEGTVRVTAPTNLASTYLPGYLAGLAGTHPGIRVEVLASGTDDRRRSTT